MYRRKNSNASVATISIVVFVTSSDSTLVATSADIFRDRSTKITLAAPRDNASIPTAPEPAHKSRNREPSIRGARMLKSGSRSRSEVGRVWIEGGLLNLRPRYLPAMTRIQIKVQNNQRKRASSGRFYPFGLTNCQDLAAKKKS